MAEQMVSNLLIAAIIGIGLLALWFAFRKPSMPTNVPNSMLKLRQKRGVAIPKKTLPNAAKLHEHEKKLKASTQFDAPEALLDFELIQNPEQALVDDIRSHLSNIRKPHPLLLQLCRKTSEPRDLYLTIRKDPELVAKVINVANSPAFGLQQPITNLNHAIVFLGMIQVKSIATHFAVQESIKFAKSSQQVAYARIWSAGFIASSMVVELSKALGMENGAELSTRCQLNYLGDLGAIVLDHRLANLYVGDVSAFERTQTIQDYIEVNQAFLSKIIASQWNLPSLLTESLSINLLPMTHDIRMSSLTHEQRVDLIICYICCRVADRLTFNQQKDFLDAERIDYQSTGFEELFYIEELLKDNGLYKIHDVFASPSFKRSIHESMHELRSV